MFGLRKALAERLKSSGGRPGLGVSRRQKIPLDEADWKLLCNLSEMLSDDDAHGQPPRASSTRVLETIVPKRGISIITSAA